MGEAKISFVTRPSFLKRKRTKRVSRILQVYLLIVFPLYVTIALVFFRPRITQSESLHLRQLRTGKRAIQLVDRPNSIQKMSKRVVVLGGEDAFELDANRYLHLEAFRLKEAVDEYIEVAKGAGERYELSDDNGGECKPIADWAQKMFPVCNVVHELNLFENRKLGKPGWFRQAWKIDDGDPYSPKLALKTLRYGKFNLATCLSSLTWCHDYHNSIDREFLPEYYELHSKPLRFLLSYYCALTRMIERAGRSCNGKANIFAIRHGHFCVLRPVYCQRVGIRGPRLE